MIKHSTTIVTRRLAIVLMTLGISVSPGVAQTVPECVPAGGEDANGDGYLDSLVSPNTLIFNSQLDCSTRVGSGSVVVLARLLEGERFVETQPTTIGERTFIGPDTLIEGASVGSDSFILGGARLNAPAENEVTIGDRVFIGYQVEIAADDGSAVIGDGAIIRRNAIIVGGDFEPGLRVGAGAVLRSVGRAGRNFQVQRGVNIDFSFSAGDDVRVGAGTTIGSLVGLGDDVSIGTGNQIGSIVFVGSGSDIGANVSIGDFAELGVGVQVGDGATITERAIVPDATVIEAGTTFPGSP